MNILSSQQMANAIRALAMDAIEKAQSGHPGMPLGMADVATVLFRYFLKFDPQSPYWPDRDRLILSGGHGSMLLYALLYLTGYPNISTDEIKQFRQWGSQTSGHPEQETAGVEVTTGPLGHGFASAVGMALAEKLLATRFGSDLVDHTTYVLLGDGDLMEGISQEALSLAGHWRLNKLIVLFDDNHITIDGPTSLATSDDHQKRFEASGWFFQAADGHNETELKEAIAKAKKSDKPSIIACRTTIAYGSPNKAGSSASHGLPLGTDEVALTRKQLDWSYPPFEIPPDILAAWRQLGSKDKHLAWEKRLSIHPHHQEFKRLIDGELPQGWQKPIQKLLKEWSDHNPSQPTRVLSQQVIEHLAPYLPELIGGSADLTGSNSTKAQVQKPIYPDDFTGTYIHYGVREHAMGAIMNGLAVHKGFIPYGGTYLVFSDYLRPAIRLSAIMKQRVIYILTHDSIGVGEDGPTHQPIEHLASLRAMPNLNVLRPADAIEVAECWEIALQSQETPSALVLTRQNIQPVRQGESPINLCAQGAYVLKQAPSPRQVTLMASGSEVSIALAVYNELSNAGISAAVVSMPCWRLFEKQPLSYRQNVLGPRQALRVSIEAASGFGWERYVGEEGIICGVNTFGASAPPGKLFDHFKLTPKAILNLILQRIQGEAP